MQLKDVGISDQPHSRSVLVLLLLKEVGFFFSLLVMKLFDHLACECHEDLDQFN